jgi:hypothetical protein
MTATASTIFARSHPRLVFFFDGGTSGEASKAATTTSVMLRTETVATSRPCLRVPPAFQACVPSRPILQPEGRPNPAVRAGARLIRRKLASLTLQTLGRGADEPFPFRQDLRSLHVPSFRRGRRPRPRSSSVARPEEGRTVLDSPTGVRAQPEPLTTLCRWSICRAIRAGRPAIFWTTEYRPPSVTSWSISGFS